MPSARAPDQVDEIIDASLRTRGTEQNRRVQAHGCGVAGCGGACADGQSATSSTARLGAGSTTSRFELSARHLNDLALRSATMRLIVGALVARIAL